MDQLKKYEAAVINILKEYAKIKYANIVGGNHLVVDKKNHHYLIITMGWEDGIFVHDCPMHFEIKDGKIWVQHNMTEWEVGKMLEDQGVPKTDIVAGFLAPDMREYSGYAVV
jgi:hypothetical protein